ncbi:hypothetical protein M404DRAFT_35520 [Pisolithus tinctorius Marx 270]|uniref:Retrotransposon gag domain-containing protein n=1 Tax=Pisolithus tinctorius Marx 270 TaxID=870435 RepID=A0A0C3NEP4_PISTI|nr:hypothetical protein M404DRAFT_35520 [Pisolithus tinctorius Marx 270]
MPEYFRLNTFTLFSIPHLVITCLSTPVSTLLEVPPPTSGFSALQVLWSFPHFDSHCAFAEAYVNENTTALGDLKIFNGWDEFVTKLKETFQVGDAKATALIYLSTIHQGDCSLDKYIADFRNCLNKAQISTHDTTAMVFFGKGLNEEVNKWILMSGPKPDTVEDWIRQATVACAAMATLKVFSGKATFQDCSYLWKQEQGLHGSKSTSSQKPLYRDPYTIDVDRKSKV